ncbi:MAG: SDR family oxidoreductase [Opitutales bacterium]
MSFLGLKGNRFLVLGVANRKSVAWAVAGLLESEGAQVIYSVRSNKRREEIAKLLDGRPVYVCDVEREEEIANLAEALEADDHVPLDGILHSVAFADYSEGLKPFHETNRKDFLRAIQVSTLSLVEIANACKPILANDASVVTIGISSIHVTAENYGYMAPVKAALETSVRYLAKSFSADSEVRFNSVNAGPLKTSASAGIPGYLENYLYAEKLTFRKRALDTVEVANLATFLLSSRSSGINGQGIVIDAGMGFNYFDKEVVEAVMKPKA